MAYAYVSLGRATHKEKLLKANIFIGSISVRQGHRVHCQMAWQPDLIVDGGSASSATIIHIIMARAGHIDSVGITWGSSLSCRESMNSTINDLQ